MKEKTQLTIKELEKHTNEYQESLEKAFEWDESLLESYSSKELFSLVNDSYLLLLEETPIGYAAITKHGLPYYMPGASVPYKRSEPVELRIVIAPEYQTTKAREYFLMKLEEKLSRVDGYYTEAIQILPSRNDGEWGSLLNKHDYQMEQSVEGGYYFHKELEEYQDPSKIKMIRR